MTPFQQFRLWVRRAPLSERVITGVATIVAVALLVWFAVPGATHPSTVSAIGAPYRAASGSNASVATSVPIATQANAAAAPTASNAAAGSVSSGGGPADTIAGGAGAGAPGCVAPPSSATGVSAKQIKIAVTLTNIIGPAADETFGGDPPAVLEADYRAVIDSINASGGVACRALVPTFYQANPADQTDLHQKCLDISQAGVFAELDQGSFADYPPVSCFAQHHIPYFGSYIVSQRMLDEGRPYLFDFNTYDSLYHNTVFGLRDRGFFSASNGFKKLGFVYRSCYPQIISAFREWLHQAGVSDAQLVTYDVGCPSAFANPSDVEQAVLRFSANGVTNVTTAEFVGDFPNFTTIAQQQGFHPKYGIGDDSVIGTTYSSLHPDFSNIDGAIAIVASRNAEERTSGMTPSAGTARCNAIYRAYGKPPVYQRKLGGGGRICDNLWYFVAAVTHAPALAQNALAVGLQRAGSVDFSYPEGPNDFTGPPHGGEFWRTAQFTTSCNCWRVIDPTFRPSYK
ncbi:MAG: type 1 periplasmic-binding domain-containing protein [Acidimicrobiales bacterium]